MGGRRVILGVVVLAAAGAAAVGVWKGLAQGEPAAAPPATAVVKRGLLRSVINSTGPVVARQDVPIKCKASGTVVHLPFDVSDRVKKGDVLLQLDTDDQDRAVNKAKAALTAGIAQLAQAKQELVVSRQTLSVNRMKAEANLLLCQAKHKDAASKAVRTRRLHEKTVASQEELDTATMLADVAAADVKIAEAQVEDLKTEESRLLLKEEQIKVQQANVDQCQVDLDVQLQQLKYATVHSLIDGVVASLVSGKDAAGNDIITRIGSVVQSGTANVSGGTTVMTVSDHSKIFVYANVAESDIGRVTDPQLDADGPEQRVRITADAYPDEVFRGKVVRVADQGSMTSNVVVFEVRIEVDSPNKALLKPKMTANVEIIVLEKSNALLVPLAAFGRERGGAAGGATSPATRSGEIRGRVNVSLPDGTVAGREVTVGHSDMSHYEVLAGLEEGEKVLLNAGMDSRWQREKLPGSRGGRP